MGEFRIGRKFAQHSYPDTPRPQPAGAFARNSANGVTGQPLAVTVAGVQIPWFQREVAGPTPVDVPITPKSTGAIHISGVFQFQNNNTGAGPQDAKVQLQFGGVNFISVTSTVETVGEGPGTETIPLDLTIPGGFLPIGTTQQVEIKVSAGIDDTSLVLTFATLSIEEVQPPTG